MTNSSTPSEPSSNPSSTDDEPIPDDEERGFRVRVVYPILAEYRYAVYPNERDWRVTERPKATIFASLTAALKAAEVINEDPDVKAVKGKASVEIVPSFDPDWCIAPGESIKERYEQLGISRTQLAQGLGFSEHELTELLTGKIVIGQVVADKLVKILGGSNTYWINLDRNYRQGLLMGRRDQ